METSKKIIYSFIATLGVIALVLVVMAGWVGNLTFAQGNDPLTVVTPTTTSTFNEGAQILALLTEMQNIKLDTAIFTDPMFANLKDFTVELAEQPKSRPNPFARIGKDTILTLDAGTTVSTSPFAASSSVPLSRTR